MRYERWRSHANNMIQVICGEGEFNSLPSEITHLGWVSAGRGAVDRLKAHYRVVLTEQGFVLVHMHPSKFRPEEG